MCVIGARKSSKNLKNVAVGHTKEVDNGFASLVYNVALILTISVYRKIGTLSL